MDLTEKIRRFLPPFAWKKYQKTRAEHTQSVAPPPLAIGVNMFQHIPFEFVNALDGQEYKLTAYDKKMIEGNEYEKYGIHIPSLVCANYMHLNLLDECSKQDLPYFIFEDDVELTKNKAPENYFETLASVVDLDAFWLIAGTPTIAAYVVWPSGAKIMKNYIIRSRE